MTVHLSLLFLVIGRLSLFVYGVAEVKLKNTIISGTSVPDLQQEFFGGIPFADPPIGNLRFAPPVLKLDPEVPILNATQYGPACAQAVGFGYNASQIESLAMSEDCLTLNILRPAGLKEDTRVPVMFWVYGGGFQNGGAIFNNGTAIVTQSVKRGTPVIFVNINYRLGPFGFPQGPEAEVQGALNIGNRDIIAAMEWVQSNIATFGGDRDKVTVFGVSAGAILLSQLLLDPKFDLARAAIFESGSPSTNTLVKTSSRALAWQTLASAVPECEGVSANSTFDCLRRASAQTIVNATNYVFGHIPAEFPFAPVIDGPGGIISDLPSRLYKKGAFSRIPFITGTCLDEGTVFIPTSMNSSELLRIWLVSNATSPLVTVADQDPVVDKILRLYPDTPALGSPFGTGNETFGLSSVYKQATAVFADGAFTSLRRQLAQAASGHGVKAFSYLFTDPQTGTDPAFLGVPHGCEIPYLFGTPQIGPASVTLSHNIIDYWVSFATSLDPNDGLGNSSRPVWMQYTPTAKNVMQLNSEDLKMIPDTFREEQIAYLIDNAEALSH